MNPVDALPKATFNVPVAGGGEQANFTFENRLVGDGGVAWLYSFRDNLTWIKGSHTFKGGLYVEKLKNTEGLGSVGAGPWAGQFNFSTDTANPLDTRYAYSNALLGVFRDYTEVSDLPEVQANRYQAEWYVQDTWKASRRLTLDYGVRFLWYKPWSTSLPAATFVPERYDPAKAPRLYQPARINNTNVALRPGDRPGAAQHLRGRLRPRHRRPHERHGAATTTPTTPRASATTRASTPSRASGSPTT